MARTSFLFNAESRYATETATFNATYTPDAYRGFLHVMLLTSNVTMSPPVNGQDGQEILIRFVQDGTGSRTLTLANSGAGFHVTAGITLTLSTAASAVDHIRMVYDKANNLWHITSFAKQ